MQINPTASVEEVHDASGESRLLEVRSWWRRRRRRITTWHNVMSPTSECYEFEHTLWAYGTSTRLDTISFDINTTMDVNRQVLDGGDW